jgi:adenosylhomocysteinase
MTVDAAVISTYDFESARLDAYFSHLATRLTRADGVVAVCVAHGVSNTVHFLTGIEQVVDVGLLLLKPKTAHTVIGTQLSDTYATFPLSREWAASSEDVVGVLESHGLAHKSIVIVDIGGYFAKTFGSIASRVEEKGGTILGVLEGTENGWQEYERSIDPSCSVPVVSVARSPLKLPEDYLVGSSIVFSIEAILREQAQILQTRTACVVGYGRVGRGVASVLRGRGIATSVHDASPIAMAEATARGFQVYRRVERALASADLIVYATGQRAFDKIAMAELKLGAVVATVTSGDEVVDADLASRYTATKVSNHITRFDDSDHRYFWLLNDGNAVNFVHGAVIGPAIQLIEGEKLMAISRIASGNGAFTAGRIRELPDKPDRNLVADIWNEHFLAD